MTFEESSETPGGNLSLPQDQPRRKSPWVRTIVYLCLAALAAFIVWRIYQNQQIAKQQSAAQAAALVNRPAAVQAVAAEKKPMPIYLTALGTVTPYMSVTVKARVSGELLPVRFTEGQLVKQGQTILQIDPKPYRAALDQAKGTLAHDQALLRNAQALYDRYKALYEAGVASKETMEANQSSLGQYQGAIESDKAAVASAQLQVNWCSVQSPITGKIGLRMVDPGNIITANTTSLVVINQFQPIAVYFTVPENQLQRVLHKLNAEHQLAVDAYDRGDTHKIASGRLLTADNQIDTTTGTVRLKAVFDNKDQALFPNQFVNVHLTLEERPDAIVIPSAAIQTGSKGSFVWALGPKKDGLPTVQIQQVKVAVVLGDSAIIESGVTEDQMVVVDGAERLQPGQRVFLPRPGGAPAGGWQGNQNGSSGSGK
jgi:multidrug efflux system membrane fusion protein